jgi:hypothetical protein
MAVAKARYEATGRKATLYDHRPYQARTWNRQLRLLIQAETGADGTNRRFVITNRPGDAQRLFHFYEARGNQGSMIKEPRDGVYPRLN